jgi:hypothetical protein
MTSRHPHRPRRPHAYFTVAIDQAFIHHNFWNGLIWLGYAVAQIGLWHVTVQP